MNQIPESGADALEAMAGAIDQEQETIQAQEATEAQKAMAEQFASDEQKAKELAIKAMAFAEMGLKMIDSRLGIDKALYERAQGDFGLVPVIMKHRLFETVEPPPWVKEYSPYALAIVFCGTVAFSAYAQLKAIRAEDELKEQAAKDAERKHGPTQ